MKYSALGTTGLEVSALGLGTAPLGELFGPVDESDAIHLVHEAIDLGVTFFDSSPYYGSAEARLGKALANRRDTVVVATKAGRYGFDDFDFSPGRIRAGVERSLTALGTDHVDVLQLHDIEFVPLGPVFEDGYAELLTLRDEGKTRAIGMTGYPVFAMTEALRRTNLDVLLTYAHSTLLDDTLQREFAPVAAERGTALINAAAVALGLLTPGGSTIDIDHPSTPTIQAAAAAMVELCASRGTNIATLANQYSIQRSGAATTLIGTGKSSHLRAAVDAVDAVIDEDLLADVLALRPPLAERTWSSGLPQNNGEHAAVSTS